MYSVKQNWKTQLTALLAAVALLLPGLTVIAMATEGGANGGGLSLGGPGAATPGDTATPSVTGLAQTITFDVPQNEYGETVFYLTEGIAVTEADLLLGVSAADENGADVPVTVQDTDGLDMQSPKMGSETYPNIPYVITYEAEHPVTGDVFTETRELYITLGTGDIMPLASNQSATWNSATPPNLTTLNWDGGGNVITVGANASGDLTIPAAVTELTIDGGGNTINGSISMTTGSLELTLKNVTINGSSDSAVSGSGGSLKLIIDGTVRLNGAAGHGALISTANSVLVIDGSGTLYATGGSSITAGGIGISVTDGISVNSNCTVYATGGDGEPGNDGISVSGTSGTIENNGTIIAKGGSGTYTYSGRGIYAIGGITNKSGGIITATGGNGSNSTNNAGGNGGSGIYAGASGNVTNESGGTIIATGGNGSSSTNNAGGDGGVGVFTGGSITNNAGSASDFKAAGGKRGSGNPDGNDGQPYNKVGHNIYIAGPAVSFTVADGLDLANSTPLSFQASDHTLLSGCNFTGIQFVNVTKGGAYGYELGSASGVTYSGGLISLPDNAANKHIHGTVGGSGGAGSALTPGNYRAQIIFTDSSGGPRHGFIYYYYVEFAMFDSSLSPNPPSPPSPSSGSDRDSGSSRERPANTWLERDPAAILAGDAKKHSENYVRTRTTGIYGVRGNAWDRLSGLSYRHDTMETGAIQVRLYISEPATLTKDTRVSGYVKGVDVDITKRRFEKWFNNKLQVIHFDHQGVWGQTVRVAAKVDLVGMDTSNLYFYVYDKKTSNYMRIKQPDYRTDKNGYLHFATEYAWDIIISDGKLEKK